jgi:hypothetical protein
MVDMQRLLLILTLAIAAAACGGKKGGTTPTASVPKVTEAPLSKDSLIVFVKERFPDAIASGVLVIEWGSEDMDTEVIGELAKMGVTTTGQLNAIVPADYQTKGMDAVKASSDPTTNITGLMRDIMIIHDAKKYFGEIWGNSWASNGPEDFPAPIAYGVDMKILEDAGVFSGGGEGGDPCEGYGDGDGDPCGDPCGDYGGDPCGD